MGSLFSTPSAPAPDPELEASQKRQEARLEAEERQKKLQIAARQRARRTGGQRLLLSPVRADAEKGIQETLG